MSDFRDEIWEVESAFSRMASEEGVEKAFLSFAAPDAVLNRDNKIYHGAAGIIESFNSSRNTPFSLTWKPDFIDVSASGDMAYTYGKYNYQIQGKDPVEGIFHTVWRRQPDGSWRFVYD